MIEESQILDILETWSSAISRFDLKERDIVKDIIRCHNKGKNKEVIDLLGIRRSGKSSILALLKRRMELKEKEFLYVNFEEPLFVNDYNVGLIEKIWQVYKTRINPDKKPYIFFDEIQLIPAWEKWIRKIRDLELAHVFVTGSSSDLLSKEFGTSLTGRHMSFRVFPLSFKEFMQFNDVQISLSAAGVYKNKARIINLFYDYLNIGGFPEIALNQNADILKTYFDDILYKDIISRHNIRNVNSLKRLAVFCLTNIANNITYNSLGKQFSLSLDTVKDYLFYFEEAFLIFQIPLYSYSLKLQEKSARKIYCIDNGLRNAVSFRFSKDEGRLAENLVFIELKRKDKDIYYWRSKGEVDFVIKNKDNSLTAINVTYSDKIEEREINGLKEFKQKFSKKAKDMIIITKDMDCIKENIKYIPLWKWLLQKTL
ncbi:MAG: ATP-binding protein [Nanoarchaeota archaeon]|nr:ATP-binding protein [Nanoarchaeota archaeon]